MDKTEKEMFLSNEEADIDPEGEFANTRSITHLRALLKNYRAVTEAQESLINSSSVLSSKIPTPEEIVTVGSRF